ncbi:hypothetical protein K402DRAFT_387825, partial [Aulographum hederae CBS 113979]
MESDPDTPIRKRPFKATTTTNSKKNHTNPHQKYETSREAIFAARDLVVLASQLSQDRAEQSKMLDLLQIFREYTEKGQVRYASSIIASQVASLENISKRIDNKTKFQKPSQPPIQLPAQPSARLSIQPWTTVQRKAKSQGPHQGAKALKTRQLILIRTVQAPINPLKIRDAINNAFSQKGVDHKVIASVSLSKTNQNIILTTMQSFTGQYLLDQRAIWEKEVSFSTTQLNQSWFK